MAVNDADKFLTGLLQPVNVDSQTIRFRLSGAFFPLPTALIEKTIATKCARFIPFL